MSANSFHFTLDFSNHLSNFAVGCDDNEKFCKFPGQIHTWRPGWESNPDHENHELSAFYVPDTVLVLLLLLQFCNNNKEIWSPESVRNLTKHTAEPEILSQLSPTVTPSSLTISNAPGPQGRVVFLPPPGTRPPGGTPPRPVPQGPRNGFQQHVPSGAWPLNPLPARPAPLGQRIPMCLLALPALEYTIWCLLNKILRSRWAVMLVHCCKSLLWWDQTEWKEHRHLAKWFVSVLPWKIWKYIWHISFSRASL